MENQTPLQKQIQALQEWANGNYFQKYANTQNQAQKYFDEVQELSELVEGRTIKEINSSPKLMASIKDELGDVLVTALMFAAITNTPIVEVSEPTIVQCNYIKLLNNACVNGRLQVNTIIALCNNFALTYNLGALSNILKDVNIKLSMRQISESTACWFYDGNEWRFIKEKDFEQYVNAEPCAEWYQIISNQSIK